MIRAKVAEYMERAEKLKAFISENDASNKRKPSAMGANGKSAGGSGKGGYVHVYLPCAISPLTQPPQRR